MKKISPRFFIIAPGKSDCFYGGTVGFIIYPDGKAKRLVQNGKDCDYGAWREEILLHLNNGLLIEIPEPEYALCQEDVLAGRLLS